MNRRRHSSHSQRVRSTAVGMALFCLGYCEPSQAQATAPHHAPQPAIELQLLNDQRVMHLNEEGNRLYLLGQYRKALERFLQAHAIDSDPNLLFNIGNCYEKMGDAEAATEKYQEFLAAPGTDPEGRSRASIRLQALAAATIQQPPANAAPPLRTDSDSLSEERWLREHLPWITLTTGSTFALAGAIFYGAGYLDHSRVDEARSSERRANGTSLAVSSLTRIEALELIDSGRRNKTIGSAGLSLGLGLLATYVGVYWWDTEDEQLNIAIQPNLQQPGFRLQGNF